MHEVDAQDLSALICIIGLKNISSVINTVGDREGAVCCIEHISRMCSLRWKDADFF